MHILKVEISYDFSALVYALRILSSSPTVFPLGGDDEELVVITLTLLLGWKNLPTTFYMATETVEDLANAALRLNNPRSTAYYG